MVLDLGPAGVRQRSARPPGRAASRRWAAARSRSSAMRTPARISLLDVASLRVRHVLEGFGEPRYAAAAPGGRYAYVTDAARGELVVIDLPRARVVASRRRPARSPATSRSLPMAARCSPRSGRRRPRSRCSTRPIRGTRASCARSRRSISRTTWSCRPTDAAVGHVRDDAAHRRARSAHARAGAEARRQARRRSTSRWREPACSSRAAPTARMRVHRPDGRLLRTTRIPLDSYNVTYGFGHVVTPSLMLGTVTTLGSTRRVHPSREGHTRGARRLHRTRSAVVDRLGKSACAPGADG